MKQSRVDVKPALFVWGRLATAGLIVIAALNAALTVAGEKSDTVGKPYTEVCFDAAAETNEAGETLEAFITRNAADNTIILVNFTDEKKGTGSAARSAVHKEFSRHAAKIAKTSMPGIHIIIADVSVRDEDGQVSSANGALLEKYGGQSVPFGVVFGKPENGSQSRQLYAFNLHKGITKQNVAERGRDIRQRNMNAAQHEIVRWAGKRTRELIVDRHDTRGKGARAGRFAAGHASSVGAVMIKVHGDNPQIIDSAESALNHLIRLGYPYVGMVLADGDPSIITVYSDGLPHASVENVSGGGGTILALRKAVIEAYHQDVLPKLGLTASDAKTGAVHH